MIYPIEWPTVDGVRFAPAQMTCELAFKSRSGGLTINGSEQVVGTRGERWEASMTLPAMSPPRVVAWQGFLAQMRGRVGSVLMPAFPVNRPPYVRDAFGRQITPDMFRGIPGVAGGRFAVRPGPGAQIVVTVSGAFAAGSTQIVLNLVSVGEIAVGHRFSIGPRLYSILSIARDGGRITVEIAPPLRKAVQDGDAAEFLNPVCQMKFATDNEGVLQMDYARIARPTVNFVEAY